MTVKLIVQDVAGIFEQKAYGGASHPTWTLMGDTTFLTIVHELGVTHVPMRRVAAYHVLHADGDNSPV
jgi:hypothetical protein